MLNQNFLLPLLLHLIIQLLGTSAISTDSIEYNLPKYNTNQWKIGDTISFTLPPLKVQVTGKVESVQLFDGLHYFIYGSVPNDGWFVASYFKDSMNANINYMSNNQFELRPSLINKSSDITMKTYTMRKVDVNTEYIAKEKDIDSNTPGMTREMLMNSLSSSLAATVHSYQSMMPTNSQPFSATTKVTVTDLKKPNKDFHTNPIQIKATTNLRVLVLYTKQAVTASGSESNLQATILLAVGNFNNANVNSNVDISVDYVAERMVEYDTYVEDPSMSTMLNQMGSGIISTARRYVVGAHAVQLVTNNAQYCGLGNYAFSGQTNGLTATYYGCIGGYGSLAHEVGHNIGLHHDLSVYTGSGINHGSCWDVSTSTGCRRSVMAYASCKTASGRTNCDRVMYWSSPAISDSENVIGDNTNMNNAQQLRNNIGVFTSLYTMTPSATPTVITAPTNGIVSTLTPTFKPSSLPTSVPSSSPAFKPTSTPSKSPTIIPTMIPSVVPTKTPVTASPTSIPSNLPTRLPTCKPTLIPSFIPTTLPTLTSKPSSKPSIIPTAIPITAVPTKVPSPPSPSITPTYKPSVIPTKSPTRIPSKLPTMIPTGVPFVQDSSSFEPTEMMTNNMISSFSPSMKGSENNKTNTNTKKSNSLIGGFMSTSMIFTIATIIALILVCCIVIGIIYHYHQKSKNQEVKQFLANGEINTTDTNHPHHKIQEMDDDGDDDDRPFSIYSKDSSSDGRKHGDGDDEEQSSFQFSMKGHGYDQQRLRKLTNAATRASIDYRTSMTNNNNNNNNSNSRNSDEEQQSRSSQEQRQHDDDDGNDDYEDNDNMPEEQSQKMPLTGRANII